MKKFWKKVVEFFKIVSEGIDKTQYKNKILENQIEIKDKAVNLICINNA